MSWKRFDTGRSEGIAWRLGGIGGSGGFCFLVRVEFGLLGSDDVEGSAAPKGAP